MFSQDASFRAYLAQASEPRSEAEVNNFPVDSFASSFVHDCFEVSLRESHVGIASVLKSGAVIKDLVSRLSLYLQFLVLRLEFVYSVRGPGGLIVASDD